MSVNCQTHVLSNGLLIHNYVLPITGVQKKVLYHFSDVHLALSDEHSSPEETDRSQKSTVSWQSGRKGFAMQYGESCTKAQEQPASVHFENMLRQAASDGDALVMCGDIFDSVPVQICVTSTNNCLPSRFPS